MFNTNVLNNASKIKHYHSNQRWSRGHKARGQGHKKKIQGQGQPFRGQTLSRPKTGMLEAKNEGHKRKCSPNKKKVFKNFFRLSPEKNVFRTIFQALHKTLPIQKIVLSSSRGQANFRGLEASRPRPRTSKCVLEAKDVLEDSTSDSNTHTQNHSGTRSMKCITKLGPCVIQCLLY